MVKNASSRLGTALIPCFGFLIIVYFVYHTLHGDRGFFSYVQLKSELATAEQKLDVVQKKRETLEHRVALMHPDRLDADMLEEQIRRNLGYANPQDIIIFKDDDTTAQ